MLPTPETSHVDRLPVYPPSEDSFLLLDTIEAQSEFLKLRFPASLPPVIAEVGTGSGVVIAFLAAHAKTLFGHTNVALLAFDLNSYACRAAGETVSRASLQSADSTGLYLGGCMSDLTCAMRAGSIDILLFNPPYVPSDELPILRSSKHNLDGKVDFETESLYLDLAVSGGVDGMETTWKLLGQLDQALSSRGVAYVLLCARNKPSDVVNHLSQLGWETEMVGSSGKKGGIEKLCILRISRRLSKEANRGQ